MNTLSSPHEKYRVVALRYRPDDFDALIGQSQVATALRNAIQQNRVGHAYLFTGARGVGKTSSARIFAKCLNCVEGPTIKPCGQCDICLGVSTGEDVDVLEIDGASNRGIDEIRQLRANANVRPSRARYKIYIIDEVHMLTVPAFNALLKTLEEPPEHVKFIFCTTDPEKIPITVLSRCQRFDFPPIKTQAIVERLRHILEQERIVADDKALELLARRANGSMRDSQSLLEQLLSYAGDRITVSDVHGLLGTADNDVVLELAEAVVAGDASAALSQLHQAVENGVEPGQLAIQLQGMFRDAMARLVGCEDELMLYCSADDMPRLQQLASELGVERVLTVLQVLDQALIKARHSPSLRTLLETTLVRCCHVQDIDQIPQLMRQLQAGPAPAGGSRPQPAAAAKKKPLADPPPGTALPAPAPLAGQNPAAAPVDHPGAAPLEASSPSSVSDRVGSQSVDWESTWRNVLAEFNDLTADSAANFDSVRFHGGQLIVTLKSTLDQDMCDRPEPKRRLEDALQQMTGQLIRVDFRVDEHSSSRPPKPRHVSRRQRIRDAEQNEFVKAAVDLFDGEIVDVKPATGKQRSGKSTGDPPNR